MYLLKLKSTSGYIVKAGARLTTTTIGLKNSMDEVNMTYVAIGMTGLWLAGMLVMAIVRRLRPVQTTNHKRQGSEEALSIWRAAQLLDRSNGESLRAAYGWNRAGRRGRVDVSQVTSYEEELTARRIVQNDERAREMGIRVVEKPSVRSEKNALMGTNKRRGGG